MEILLRTNLHIAATDTVEYDIENGFAVILPPNEVSQELSHERHVGYVGEEEGHVRHRYSHRLLTRLRV